MVAGQSAGHSEAAPQERSFPPVTEIAVASMIFVIVGGIYIASYVPRTVALAIPIVVLALALVLLVTNIVILSRLRDFAWTVFFQVFRWTLLAYAVIAGMIGYVFIDDGTRGSLLVILVSMLLIFAVDIPVVLSFAVARFQDVDEPA
jgi:hypothetical protein